jgi:hypothetical protein
MVTSDEGGARGFSSRCPRTECGVPLATPEPKTVTVDSSAELNMLLADKAQIEASPDPSEEDREDLKRIQHRIRQLTTPRAPATPRPPFVVVAPSAPTAPAPSAPSFHVEGDFIAGMRARLAQIESEARKLRAMLAVADVTL